MSDACPAPNSGTATCAGIAADEAIGTAGIKLAKIAAVALGKCTERALAGEPGYGPAGATCTDTSGTPQAAIAGTELKSRAKIAKKCAGPDKMLGTPDDLDPQDVLGFPATCPGLPHCSDPVPGVSELSDCAVCVATKEVEQALEGVLALPLPAADDCIVELGRAAARLAERTLDDRSDCDERVIRGSEPPPCPDANTLDDIADEEFHVTISALPSCSALDPQTDLGFGASCLNVGACGAIDISDAAGLLECVRCVTAERTILLVDTLYPVSAEEPDAAREGCRLAIGRELAGGSPALGRRKLSTLRICEGNATCGQIAGPCPDSEALARIDPTRADAAAEISSECAGIDPQDLGFATSCPALYTCGGQETDSLPGLITCLTCITDGVADELIELSFRGP